MFKICKVARFQSLCFSIHFIFNLFYAMFHFICFAFAVDRTSKTIIPSRQNIFGRILACGIVIVSIILTMVFFSKLLSSFVRWKDDIQAVSSIDGPYMSASQAPSQGSEHEKSATINQISATDTAPKAAWPQFDGEYRTTMSKTLTSYHHSLMRFEVSVQFINDVSYQRYASYQPIKSPSIKPLHRPNFPPVSGLTALPTARPTYTTPILSFYKSQSHIFQSLKFQSQSLIHLQPSQVPSTAAVTASPGPSPYASVATDDMSRQTDDMNNQLDDMSQQMEYLLEQSFLSNVCEGFADQLTVTTLGRCFNKCIGCGSLRYEVTRRNSYHAEIASFHFSDDACSVGRARVSSTIQTLACESGPTGAQVGGFSSAYPSFDDAIYYVTRSSFNFFLCIYLSSTSI